MTPPRIRGLVQRFEKAIRMEFHDKANRPSRKRETAVARIDLLRAFAVVATPPASPDVEGLVKALEAARNYIGSQPVKTSPWRDGNRSGHRLEDGAMGTLRILDKIDAALYTWRQAQENKP